MATLLAIDSSQWYDVTAPGGGRRVIVKEDYDSSGQPSCDLVKAEPYGNTGSPEKVSLGQEARFVPDGGVYNGMKVGQIKTRSGSCTVAIRCEGN